MEVIIIEEGKHARQAHIIADWEYIEQEYEDLVTEYERGDVSGFRPGKAPRSLVESRFRRQILDHVASRCVERITRQALAKKKMTAVGPVAISDIVIDKNKPLRFTAAFTELPDFDLPNYTEYRLNSSSDEQRRDEISRWLLENTAVSIPDDLIKQELSLDGQQSVESGSDEWQAACNRVKLLLMLEKVAAQDGVDIDEHEVQERIEKIADEYNENVVHLRKQLLSSGGMSRMRSLLLAEKTLDYLLEICS